MGGTAEARQREYYARTADHYDAMHITDDDEHGIALASFAGLAKLFGVESVLDVGAGTGRALLKLSATLSECRIVGVEPVEALREVGYSRGLSREMLVEGDAMLLPFADDSFDFVIETGMLHHIPIPAAAVAEMLRVARLGVMISDSNNYGQGNGPARWVKWAISRAGLWRAWIWLTTRGRMAKWSEGDGVFYSYSVFDSVAQVKRKVPRAVLMNTVPAVGTDMRRGAGHVALFATR
jgi:ubiquinone/menaquinone biosynthesis C-methylase UbiE